MATIPLRLNDTDLEKIDYLIAIGKYKNRSQAIRMMLHAQISKELLPLEWDTPEDQEKRREIIGKLTKQPRHEIEIRSKKSAVELVRAQRDG